jgi:hypothetical protein
MRRNLSLGLAPLAFFLAVPAVLPEVIPVKGRVASREAVVELELVPLAVPGRGPVSAPAAQAGGAFQVSAPEPGFWRLIARARGAAPAAFDLLPLLEPAALPPLHLIPARRIRVGVTDPAGRPLPGAALRIEAVKGPEDSAPGWLPAPASASTGEDGAAFLDVSPSLSGLLTVTAPGLLPEWQEIGPGATGPLTVRLRPGVSRVLEARSAKGRPVSGVAVSTEAGVHLGITDAKGLLPVTVPERGETGLRLLAPDCRWARGALKRGSESVFTLQPPRALRGSVVDRPTRQPLAGAWVWVEGFPSCSARAGKDGKYSLALPGFAEARLRAAASGYRPEALAVGTAPPAEVPVLALTPVPGRPASDRLALSGRVVDPAGDPVAGASLQALPVTGLESGGLAAGREAVTSSDGSFSLSGFREGEALTLRVEKKGFAVRTMQGLQVPVPEPLTLVLTPAARITGTVVDESGNPLGGAKLLLSQDLGDDSAQGPRRRLVSAAETDREGRFELAGLAPGRFRLAALSSGFLPETGPRITLVEGEGIEGIEIVLRRGAVIEGRISIPDGSPAAGAKVVVLDTEEESGLGLVGRPGAVSDREGRYEIGGVSEGDHTVLADLNGFQPARGQIRVEAGANRLDLRLEEGFEVSGRVSGPEGPVPGAVLRLLPQQEGSTAPFPGSTGSDGAFRFPAVAEGRYRVEVEKPGYAMASTSLEVQVEGAPVTNLEVKLERGGAVAGRILGLEAQDLAQVQIMATAPGRTGQAGQVDPEGRYRIEGLGPGEWNVLASLPQGTQTGSRVVLAVGQAEARLDLEFSTGFVLSGRVERDRAAVGGAVILAEGADGNGGNAVTGPDGRFRLEGLRPGAYAITVLDPRSQARLDLRLELEGDREMVFPLPGPGQPGR